MITILAILITWYITKYYYTRSFRFEIEQSDLIRATCSKCARTGYVSPENLRAPYYCMLCKQSTIGANPYIPPPIICSDIALRRLIQWSKVEHSGEYILQIHLHILMLYLFEYTYVIEHTIIITVMSNRTIWTYIFMHIFRDLSRPVVNGIFGPHLSIDFEEKF